RAQRPAPWRSRSCRRQPRLPGKAGAACAVPETAPWRASGRRRSRHPTTSRAWRRSTAERGGAAWRACPIPRSENSVLSIVVDQRAETVTDAYTPYLPEQHAMRGKFLCLDQFAIEHGRGIRKRRRAGRDRVPCGERETLILRQARKAGKSVCEVLPLGRQRVERKHAVVDIQVVCPVVTVEADENRRRVVRNRAGRDDGCAAPSGPAVGGDDMHRAGEAAHGVTVLTRLDFGLLQHPDNPARFASYIVPGHGGSSWASGACAALPGEFAAVAARGRPKMPCSHLRAGP